MVGAREFESLAYGTQNRTVAGAVLVTPFDSLMQLARTHYPWAPVQLLLRHQLEPAADLRGSPTPVAIIAAAHDEIIPTERTDALRRALGEAIPGVVFDAEIQAGHNDIYSRPEMTEALRAAVAVLAGIGREHRDP